ncbi:HEAT repeat domain-containing protein [Fodinibius halophilus]|uniref:HEAT repeat domain-containing protein n=1 Tax=Fodinibius halophilus TaxID=1736908 RepID=A0A6M1T696_9BACT|nr:HEAT repeat domain-containing protein [Fodinibius halophilus]NGP88153.1 HEAT repeat domain-containing protein [Fodinibius halophilus]
MINEQYIELITAYIDDSITSEQRVRLNDLIDKGEIDIDIKQMEATYKKMGQLPAPEPSDQMREAFYDMIGNEKEQQVPQKSNTWINRIEELFAPKKVPRMAFFTVIFLVGMFTGNLLTPFQDYQQQMDQLSGEVSKMRQVMMMSLLDNQSSSERLKAVNISTDIQTADKRVVTALLKTLNNDSNVNVRLASIQALLHHAENPRVRRGLIRSISRQTSPQIQVALADAMLALQETQSVDELQKLLQQNELDSTVRDKLKNTIAALS